MLTHFVLALVLMPSQFSIANKQSPGQIAGDCRQTQRLERIYSDADLGSPSVRDIPRAAIVTLAGEVNQPTAGWIRISSPAEGYILATFLAPCGSVDSQLQPLALPLPNFRISPPVNAPPRLYIPPALPQPLPYPPSQLRLPLPSPSPSPVPNSPEP